jgi:hypothetical protein
MKDTADMQWFLIPALVGYTGSAWGVVNVRIIDTYPTTTAGKGASMNEVQFKATNLDSF